MTSARDGGTTGKPSVQPRSKQNSICSATLIGVQVSPSAPGTSITDVFVVANLS
jgi:hypothetical protein